MIRFRSVSLIAFSALMIAACGKTETPVPKTGSSDESKQTRVDATKEPSQADRETYMKSARKELDELKIKIDELTAKAKTSSADVKAKLESSAQGFRDDIKVLDKRLDDLKNTSATAWEDMKNAMNDSIAKLRAAIQKETQ